MADIFRPEIVELNILNDLGSTLKIPVLCKASKDLKWLRNQVYIQMSDIEGARLFWGAERLNPEQDDRHLDYFDALADRPLRVLVFTKPMKTIFVKTLTGKTFEVFPDTCDEPLKHVKLQIYWLEGIPIESQRLVFAGKELKDDGRSLADYNIQPGATLFMIQRVRGGGGGEMQFVNLSDRSIIEQLAFSKNAPSWRVVDEGLNIDGEGTNEACKAYKTSD
eukprot:TRINITY_DN19236_c0_g1::TRINITY_DN19236_c0_g1_i1::g.15806::m.15806 TRINITY_DN19236_c0_g1::TRINITY_DN19236_c0_g1_i1::g.15806  ORF type:complete len:221 (+),score=27.64,sp/Q3E7K8/UBQ12_ARATH/41.04/9e-20,sp/Q3E7K8/UBQ12_ARATH/40.52/2e-16,sp/Q3E7K8/UBQ12_ARATH/51.32/3e-15,ubiquitin/PF00240.18/1.5e-17,Rad60-SLD/PF11976.3/6.2e+03,Rad60-SLD/PF11976.3/0.00054,DUF434/PF04256.7/0.06,Ubiquitin_2/PF14560.1/1.4e+04,Ubiquitin_2/PF14560.1/0.18 TRINITY_DN19236_c0_g1_i1:75-737(+)